VAGIKEFPELIYNKKFRGPSPRCGGPRAVPVHGGLRIGPRRRLAGEWPERHPLAWNLAAVEEKGGGNDGEPHRLQEGCGIGAETAGRQWGKTGGGGAWCGQCSGAKRIEVGRGPVKPEVGALPFIGAGEGMPGREVGKRPTAMALTPLMAGGLMRG
jgi:hypothetical protein